MTSAISPKYYEEPILRRNNKDKTEYFVESLDNKLYLKKMSDKELIAQFNELSRNHENLFYYIRIHTRCDKSWERTCVNFQYLALLLHRVSKLRRFESKSRIDKLAVFLVPLKRNKYPFKDENGVVDEKVYKNASHYLRLLSKKYVGVIYGVSVNKGKVEVSSLDFKTVATYKTNFPLIPVDNQRYEY